MVPRPVTLSVVEIGLSSLPTAHRIGDEKSFFLDLSSLKRRTALALLLSYGPLPLANIHLFPFLFFGADNWHVEDVGRIAILVSSMFIQIC